MRTIMKWHFLLIFLALLQTSLPAAAQDTTRFSGLYNGKNLYVQNPLTAEGKGYCAQAVYVNGSLLMDAPQSSAFVVNLNHIPPQTHVTIAIVHAGGCVPKLINPQVLLEASNFGFLAVSVDSAQLYWRTQAEKESGKFFAEKYQNGAWQTVQVLPARGKKSENTYAVGVRMHSGENKFRVKYLQQDGQVYYSREVRFASDKEPVSFSPTRVSDKIYLSAPTDYIIINAEGRVLMKGFGKEILLAHLSSGLYYLRIENRKEKFFKK